MLESILCMSIVKSKQAQTVMQAAGLAARAGAASWELEAARLREPT